MAMNTPNWQKQYNATTEKLAGVTAEAGVVIVDTTKNTAAVMDGTTAGGHPLAKEALKIKAGGPNVKINGATEANLGSDITITVEPGVLPGNMVVVTDPEGQDPGQYMDVSYTKADGSEGHYYVSLDKLVDKYLAGAGIKIEGNTISVDASTLAASVAKPGAGLTTDADGNLVVSPGQLIDETAPGLTTNDTGKLELDLESIVDTTGLLQIVDGKISLKSIVSADADNNLKEGSDKGVYFPSNFGTL